MNRLTQLANRVSKQDRLAFIAGFTAARKMCALMGRIAQLEGKDAEAEILKVGTEDVGSVLSVVPPELSDVIIDTLN
jgi:hypothetical protein